MDLSLKKLSGIILISLSLTGICLTTAAQQRDDASRIYRATPTKINNLVHTKLDVSFDYARRYLHGKAWIVLEPHFYPTDSLQLDAKGMEIGKVNLVLTNTQMKFPGEALLRSSKNVPLKFEYDGMKLNIKLNKTYKKDENYTIYIEYTAKPDELKTKGSAAITDAKGLYFINPDGKIQNKPIQIWTQGETEASSVWFPTIDKTNQKTTAEISMTVDKKYVTLSNGRLASQKNNNDGTRTDTWKMEQPHAPYLFMMAVGDFAVVKDKWRSKEVNYYVEKAYAPHAKAIFGNTPDMMTFFSKILGYDFPWVKYSQVVVRDYVSGAMENTTASVFGDFVQKTERELLDDADRGGEAVIAHELFHHWFGDLVTCESWSNLTLNESFADYSEYLWFEHKYGKDAADAHAYIAMNSYTEQVQSQQDRDLVRFHYRDQENMFDVVSYQKGGRILHMLRNYVGDEAFFKALNLYLKENAFKTAEVPQLRMAFEEVTGQDLNWFFNQWYFDKGYPKLDISYDYYQPGSVRVTIQQVGERVFDLPFAIDVYAGGKKDRYEVRLDDQRAVYTFPVSARPDLVNVDADKMLLMKKTERRDFNSYIFQYNNAKLYADRREAIEFCLRQSSNPEARKLLLSAMKDPFEGLRAIVVDGLRMDDYETRTAAIPILLDLVKNDKHAVVRSAALRQLGRFRDTAYMPVYEAALKDKSYMVLAIALNAIAELDLQRAYKLAKSMEKDARGLLGSGIASVYAQNGNEKDVSYFAQQLGSASGQERIGAAILYLNFLGNVNDTELVKKGVDEVVGITAEFSSNWVSNYFVNLLTPLARKKEEKSYSSPQELRDQLNIQAAYMMQAAEKVRQQKNTNP